MSDSIREALAAPASPEPRPEDEHDANVFAWGTCPSRHFPHLAIAKTPGGQWVCDACGTEAGKHYELPVWPSRDAPPEPEGERPRQTVGHLDNGSAVEVSFGGDAPTSPPSPAPRACTFCDDTGHYMPGDAEAGYVACDCPAGVAWAAAGRAPSPAPEAARCVECGHLAYPHSDLGCTGPDGMGCDCPGWRAPAPSSPAPGKEE